MNAPARIALLASRNAAAMSAAAMERAIVRTAYAFRAMREKKQWSMNQIAIAMNAIVGVSAAMGVVQKMGAVAKTGIALAVAALAALEVAGAK